MISVIRTTLIGTDAVCAFVYGSVARGTSTSTSDLDVMVLLGSELGRQEREKLRERFRMVQVELGFRPDPRYPVELFTIADARQALTAGDPDEDQQEVRKAMKDRKIVVVDSPELAELIAMSGAST